MKLIRQNAKSVGIFFTFLILAITVPYQPVLAAMVATETVMDSVNGKQARDKINNLLLRQDVQSALKAQGIDPLEAKARIDSLSDAEVTRIADEIHKLPAGGGFDIAIPVGIIIAVIVGIVLVTYFFLSGVTPPTEVEK